MNSSGVKQEVKDELMHSNPAMVGSHPTASSTYFSMPRGNEESQLDEFEMKAPGATYTCANCTKEIFLTAESPMQCPACEHLTGSSSVFYKIRTQATTYDTI